MGFLNRISAILVMGAIAMAVGAYPVAVAMGVATVGTTDSSPLRILSPFLVVAAIVVVVAVLAQTARIAWGRLCVICGLAAFALPFDGIIFSVLLHNLVAAIEPTAASTSAAVGAGAVGFVLTGLLGFLGFFLGMILVIAGYFILRGAPRGKRYGVAEGAAGVTSTSR
jgi:hypothetical protein